MKKDTKNWWYSKKKTDYDPKISDIETKYFTLSGYNESMGEISINILSKHQLFS